MSKATSITFGKICAALAASGRAAFGGVLMALPLCGLVLFFEMTRPATVATPRFFATQIAGVAAEHEANGASKPWLLRGRSPVARFSGVSAQRRPDKAGAAQVLTASDAQRVLSEAPMRALQAGFYTEYLTRDRHRISLLILSREPIVDRAIPDNNRLMNATEASTATVIAFAWGNYIFRAEVEDRGVEPDIVVQKVL